jgi:cation diffusion facilitator CzcD-associated flavoprotein CzcO
MTRAANASSVAIVGSGLAGLAMAIQLHKAGIPSFTIFEKSSRVGGTWRDNTYPGAACDVPSHLYSFSFESRADWSRVFPEQSEILSYIQRLVRRHELRRRIRFNAEIESARFDEERSQWELRTVGGDKYRFDVLILACGQLNRPAYPEIDGLAGLEAVQFHSARWNHQYDLSGKTVAAIGTGASAIQFVPFVARPAKRLFVFQRTPPWILPKPDREYSRIERFALTHVPPLRHLYRSLLYWALEVRVGTFTRGSWLQRYHQNQALSYLCASIDDPALRAALTPEYPIGCKRILVSNDYYQALCRPNVELVTSPIERATKNALVTRDGVSRIVDAVIYGTGFESTDFLAPIRITGLQGLDLRDAWRQGAEAYLGVAVSGFPNLFLLYGPNTNLGHHSIPFMIECQVRYTVRCIRRMRKERLASLEVRADAMRVFNTQLQKRHESLVWTSCNSWYRHASGRNTNNWPGSTVAYWWRTRRPDARAFHASRSTPTAARRCRSYGHQRRIRPCVASCLDKNRLCS